MTDAPSLEDELERARELSVSELADAIESIGFECTRCGACCKGHEREDGEGTEPHTATVFPDEVRTLQSAAAEATEASDPPGDGDLSGAYDWRDVARPMPYGLSEGADGPEGETFEWALQTDACGDCAFYEEVGERADGTPKGGCRVHEDRPLICETYPFSVALGGTTQPMGEAVDEAGMVRAHECEGLGRDISRQDAEELAAALKERAVRELEEAIGVRDNYEPVDPSDHDGVVVYDSEGPKRPDGTAIRDAE
ncbi:YkgJ family cysteine cluster protein [Halobellus rufus]|uniref:YkgJ family cysteine cluster protein n=1 Tax=Halobellus rufus TaxID=1448860 RepID=UPI0006798A72|nr:YkgJ family cysteine cluster protein [Halobellus rufus]